MKKLLLSFSLAIMLAFPIPLNTNAEFASYDELEAHLRNLAAEGYTISQIAFSSKEQIPLGRYSSEFFYELSKIYLSTFGEFPSIDAEHAKLMSDDDLVSLLGVVTAEIRSRESLCKEVTVNPGRYIVGVDIPAGTYSLETTKQTPYSITNAVINVYSADGKKVYGESIETVLDNVKLQEGQEVEIRHYPVIFSVYTGLGF